MEYEIVTDASLDIKREIVEEFNINIIPMVYDLGEKSFTFDGINDEEKLKNFYDEERKGLEVRSSQISPEIFREYFENILKEGKSVLYTGLTGGLSSTYSQACLVANELNSKYQNLKVVCVDSMSTTCGLGMLVEAIARNKASGMTLEENATWLEQNKLNLSHWFMVDDLMFLKRGGRIPASLAVVGKLMNIKPILRIFEDGKLVSFEKKMGTKKALNELFELYKSHTNGGDEVVCIVHTDCPNNVEYLTKCIKEFNPKAEVRPIMMGPIIGVHVGPGMCGVVSFGKRTVK